MGACAIYTAIPDAALVEDVLACFDNDMRAEDSKALARGWHRFGRGRLAVMALAEAFMPASHRGLARALVAQHWYSAFSPSAHAPGFVDELRQWYGLPVTVPMWPESAALAAIIGCAPAVSLGWHRRSTHGVSLVGREVVRASVAELGAHDLSAIPDDEILKPRETAVALIEWLTSARDRGDCVVLHWEQR